MNLNELEPVLLFYFYCFSSYCIDPIGLDLLRTATSPEGCTNVSDQPRRKKKTNRDLLGCSHSFSRAWCRLHIFGSGSDWFIGLSASMVIGQNDYFRFCFTALN